MNYISYIKLLVLLVYIAAVHQCEGQKRHAQNLRRSRQDWFSNLNTPQSSNYDYYSARLREEQLLMEINERLREIMLKLNQPQQQQPVYVPYYVPYYMPYSIAYNATNIRKGNKKPMNVQMGQNVAEATQGLLTTKKDNTHMDTITVKVAERNNFEVNPSEDTVDKIIFQKSLPKRPNAGASESMGCQVAVVDCCRYPEDEEKQKCFAFHKCSETDINTRGCRKETIHMAIKSIADAYGPNKIHS